MLSSYPFQRCLLKDLRENPNDSILFLLSDRYKDISELFSESVSVEIVGLRCTLKTLFLTELLRVNNEIDSILIITKGPLFSLPNTVIYTATNITELIYLLKSIAEEHSTGKCSVQIVGIDTLSTILLANTSEEKENEVYFLLKVLNTLGIRVIVVSSLITIVKKTSAFYKKSILFKQLRKDK